MAFWMWNAAKEPWGSIVESPLQSADLENTSDAEYEIEYSFIEKGWHEFSTVIFRKQNSDITYRTIYSMCDDFAYKGDSIYDDFVLRRSDYAGDTSQWNNLDDKRISIVEELKRKIEEYEIEYSWVNSSPFPYTILYGDPVIVSLKNFKSRTRKELVLKNSSEAGVHKAIAIEKLMRKAWPAREAFTKLTEEEVIDIISEFLADFTGHHYDLHENDYLVYATPMLVNLTGNRGTTVIWSAEFYIPDGWYFSCAIDDKTGAILKVNFSGYGYNWDSLIFDFASANDPNTLICDKYRNAIYNNYSKRLNAKFVTYHLLQDTYDYDYASYVLIFRDGRNETFEINLGISVNNDYIESY